MHLFDFLFETEQEESTNKQEQQKKSAKKTSKDAKSNKSDIDIGAIVNKAVKDAFAELKAAHEATKNASNEDHEGMGSNNE